MTQHRSIRPWDYCVCGYNLLIPTMNCVCVARRFEKPAVVRKSNSKQIEIVNIDLLETEQLSVNGALIVLMIFIVALCTHFRDVNTELDRLTALLMKRHSKVAGRFNSVSYVLHLHSRTHTQTCSYCILYPMYPTLLPCFTCLYMY